MVDKKLIMPVLGLDENCGRNESFPNQILFTLGMGRGADATLTNLFNPILGRDASHSYLISTWLKEWCTIVCVVGGTNFSPIRYCSLWNGPRSQCHPYEFVQSHIGKRRLLPSFLPQ